MSLNDIVSVSITDTSVTPQQGNFGTPALLTYGASFGGAKSRSYSGIAGVATDFPTDGWEYLMATALFAQQPSPKSIKILNGSLPPTQQYTIDATALRANDSTDYAINVQGHGITTSKASYTSDGTPSYAKIHNGLVTALNTVVGANYTAAFAAMPTFSAQAFTVANQGLGELTITGHPFSTGDGPVQLTDSGGSLPTGLATATNYWVIKIDANTIALATNLANALAGTAIVLSSNGTGTMDVNHQSGTLSPTLAFTVTANAAGTWFSLQVVDNTALSISQTHADPGVATDLAAIRLVDQGWFTFATPANSKAYALAAAAWAEAQGDVVFTCETNDTASRATAIQSPLSTGYDTLQALAANGYNRTVGDYYSNPAGGFVAALYGRVLASSLISASADAKQMIGVVADVFTETETTNLTARRATSCQSLAGLTVSVGGATAGNKAFSVIRGLCWYKNTLQIGLFATKVASEKIEFEDSGIQRLAAKCRTINSQGIANQVIAKNPKPVVAFPLKSSLNPTDVGNRVLNAPNAIQFTLSGEVDTISLGVNVSF